jgi:hypothetical protein
MSWRSLRFHHFHYARDEAKLVGLSSNNAVNALHPLERLIDNRASVSFKYNTSAADHWVDIDLGASHTRTVNSLIIPAGHNLDSVDCELLSGAASPAATPRASFTPSGTGVIREDVEETTDRHWRFKQTTSGTHEFHQLILTSIGELDRGMVMSGAGDGPRYNFLRFEQPTGISPTLELAPPRRVIEVNFRSLQSSDLTTVKSLIDTVGMHHPFYIDPPSFAADPDADDPAIWMKFDTQPDPKYANSVPNNGTEKRDYDLVIIENVD